MNKSDFYYDLPRELIAQTPVEPRDSSRLLLYSRRDDSISDLHFRDLERIVRPGDLLVANNTRVVNARLFGADSTDRRFELLLLKRIDLRHCEALVRPARKARIGTVLKVSDELSARVESFDPETGVRTLELIYSGVFEDILDRSGTIPLPPYITHELADAERYQTVYGKIRGSSAAPTAGLHFTAELIDRLKSRGAEFAEILLHVGLGTFRPVREENILDHKMHSEYFEIPLEAAAAVNRAVREGRRVISVGTTCVRALESAATPDGFVRPIKGDTDIFIRPGYEFKIKTGLITNFHLPESTLIMLVSAFLTRDKTMEIYARAVRDRYRFFSFGDAMMIL